MFVCKKATCYNIHIEGIGLCSVIDKLMKILNVVYVIILIFAIMVLLYSLYVGYYIGAKKLILIIIQFVAVGLLCSYL